MELIPAKDNHSNIRNRIPLVPDADLLSMIDEMLATPPAASNGIKDRERQTQFARRMEAISREIKARGMSSPSCWSARRHWEVEDLHGERYTRSLRQVRR